MLVDPQHAAGTIARVTAKPEAGAVPFHAIPIGGAFYLPGQFTASNVKDGPTSYRAAWTGLPAGLRDVNTLVYPDTSRYL
jgi:hypothetical protein